MYGKEFCKVYNEFGWNYFPEAFGQQLIRWIQQEHITIKNALDIGCGTGILCGILEENGIQAAGIDLSEDMVNLAREKFPEITFEAGNMVTYLPKERYSLVTCTGDAINHVIDLSDVAQVFRNVYQYLAEDGYFIFDLLNEKETGDGEPIELDYSETVKAQFLISKNEEKKVTLQIRVYENGQLSVEETITEIVHDRQIILDLLAESGFTDVHCSHRFPEGEGEQATTWFVTARK